MAIKNIIFDLGGVVLNIDPNLTVEAFENYGLENVRQKYNFPNQVELFDDIEVGKITPAEFRDGLRELFGMPFTNEQIDKAWNAMLLDFPAGRLEALEKVQKHYSTFLLSNTNEIHLEAYLKILKESSGYNDLSHIFNKIYYSQRVGLRKPDEKLFRLVLEENGLNAEETLFIDDAAINVEAAKKVGIQAYHIHISDEEVADMFVDGRLKDELVVAS